MRASCRRSPARRAARENFRLGRARPIWRRNQEDRRPERPLLPVRRPCCRRSATAIILGYGGLPRLRREGRANRRCSLAFLGYAAMFFDPGAAASQLYSTFLSVPSRRSTRSLEVLVEEPQVTDKAGRPGAAETYVAASGSTTSATLGHRGGGRGAEVLHGIRPRRPGRLDRRPRRPHRRRQVDDRQAARIASTTRPRGAILVDGIDLREDDPGVGCGASSGSCRRRASSSPARSPRTSPSAGPRCAAGKASAAAARAVGAGRRSCEGSGRRLRHTGLARRGFRLSLGQRQLARPRALSSPIRSILILDEATELGRDRRPNGGSSGR